MLPDRAVTTNYNTAAGKAAANIQHSEFPTSVPSSGPVGFEVARANGLTHYVQQSDGTFKPKVGMPDS
jgi:hypothetical protein